jgi:PQQ enzyme repeat
LKALSSISSLIAGGLWTAILPTDAQINVTQFHNHSSRDGLYIDSAFTLSAAAKLTRDLNFDGTIVGNVYTQPLYIDDGPGGRPTIIAVTESNNVYALDAVDGSVIWERNVGDPVPINQAPAVKLVRWALSARLLSILPHGRSFSMQWSRPTARRRNITSFP